MCSSAVSFGRSGVELLRRRSRHERRRRSIVVVAMLPVFPGLHKRAHRQAARRRQNAVRAERIVDEVTAVYATVSKSANIKPD
jgi:hypothetical protein